MPAEPLPGDAMRRDARDVHSSIVHAPICLSRFCPPSARAEALVCKDTQQQAQERRAAALMLEHH